MYLLAVVTLIIGMLSIYAQVLSVEAARLAANQTSLAKTMMEWHGGAVSMAAKIIDDSNNLFPVGSAACSLTFTALPGSGLPACPTPTNGTAGTVTNGVPPVFSRLSATLTDLVHLPPNYNVGLYQFYSFMYRDAVSTLPYVVTLVENPSIQPVVGNLPPYYITLPPNGYMTSVALSDLLQQFKAANIDSTLYGTIAATATPAVLTTVAAQHNTILGFTYTFPATVTGTRMDGAVAIVSSPVGF